MTRPSRAELLHKFFPDLGQGTAGDRDAAVRFNTLACEAILADWIRLFDGGLEREGPGVLTLRLHRQATDSSYVPLLDLQQDLGQAIKDGADELQSFLEDLIEQLERLNTAKAIAVLLIDNSAAQLFLVDREHPARAIQQALEAQLA